MLEKNIDGKIGIGKMYIVFFNRIILRDISITSAASSPLLDSLKQHYHQSDTLFSCRKLSVSLSPAELLKLNIKLSSVKLEDGVFNLQKESDSVSNLARIFRLDPDRQRDTARKGLPGLLARSLQIRNFRFTLNNPDKYEPKGDSTINFSDLNISDIEVNLGDIRLENDTITGIIRNISGTDKSGFRLAALSGEARVCGTEALIRNLEAADAYSRVSAREFSMRYATPRDLSDFVNAVTLSADLQESYLNFQTIGRIAPALRDSRLAFFITGRVSGPVANLRTSSLIVASESGETVLDLDAKLIGLPDVPRTMASAKINASRTTVRDLSRIVSSIHDTPPSPVFARLAPDIRYDFKGSFAGLLTDFVANGRITSSAGRASLDMLLRNEGEREGMLFQGSLRTQDLNVGRILSDPRIGEVTLHSALSARLRKERYGGLALQIDSVRIDKAGFNGYDYSNIFAVGTYGNDQFDGRILSHDPNLDFIFQGLFSLNKKADSRYDFYADVPYANLAALHFDPRDSVSEVSLRMTANFIRTPEEDIIGTIDIRNSEFTNSAGSFAIGPVKLTAFQSDNRFRSALTSRFVNAEYDGTGPVSAFLQKFLSLTAGDHMDQYFTGRDFSEARHKKGQYRFFVETFQTYNIFQLVLPGLYLQDSTRLDVQIDTADRMDFSLRSGRIAFGSNYIKDLSLTADNRDSLLRLNLSGGSARAAGMQIDNPLFRLSGRNNRLQTAFSFGSDTTQRGRGILRSVIRFTQDSVLLTDPRPAGSRTARSRQARPRFRIIPQVHLDMDSSRFEVKGQRWDIAPSHIRYADSTLYVNNFRILDGNQTLDINGSLSRSLRDSMNVQLNRFDIDLLNLFLNHPFDMHGYFSGNAAFSSLGQNPHIFLDLRGDSVFVNHAEVGSMNIMSKWSEENRRFNIAVSSRLQEARKMEVLGYYRPDSSYIDLHAALDELPVVYFEPFLSDLISESGGSVSGNLRLHGTLGRPGNTLLLTSEDCRLNRFRFRVNFTRVPYTIDGPVLLDENGLSVRNADITDPFGGRGKVNGGLHYKHFQDITLNTRLDFENFQCLNTTDRDNESFYGSAFATGSLQITGPLQKIDMDINVQSDAGTSIHIPLSDAATAQQTNLLTFKEPEVIRHIDPYDTLITSRTVVKQPTQLNIGLRANVTPEAEVLIEINKALGDVIRANGTGLINMNINPTKEIFDVFGDYNVSQGSYKFVLLGFAAKDFYIQPGGTINFNGDIFSTNINLTAVYRTNASINTLIADTSSVSTRRTVNCGIGMSGRLTNPQLTFNIDIPDLDPTTKMKVESALNTEGKVQRQFAALLVSGGFIPEERSGIANNSTILYSNVSEILSNQLNNILQQLNIPLDLGFSYQPGEKGADLFDVAVSTQLFNNRVLINGNIGNDPYSSSNSQVIGNIDVEIKLDKSGKLSLSLFSHAADRFSNYLNDSQRNGIGFSYQQGFNTFRELFRKKSPQQKADEKQKKEIERRQRKAARQARKMQQPEPPPDTGHAALQPLMQAVQE